MDNKLKPYEQYRETEYDWLGKVPSHWHQTSIRLITELSNERNGTRNDLELLSVYREYGVIKKSSRDDNHNVESQDLSNYKYVEQGYLVLNKMKMWQGSLGVSKYRGIVSPAYIVCKLVGNLNYAYIQYLLRSNQFKTIYNRISYGVRVGQWDMRYDDFKNIKLFLPPLSEQKQIVKYLDRHLSKINKFISAKKKLILVLEEQKKALISRAIIKGINPKVKMKPSGIEWLDVIPDHWIKCKLKHLGTFKSGDSITSLEINEKGKYPVYGGNGLRGYYSNFTHDGTYLLVGRQGALCGNVHIVKGQFWASEHAIVVTPKNNIDIDWAYYLIETMNLNQYSQSAAQPGLSVEKVVNIYTVLPPLQEQKEIASYINEKVVNIDKIIKEIKHQISLIIEYRTRLVSDVVTGKVDVSGIEIEDTVFEDTEIDNIEDEIEKNGESLEECGV